MQANIYIGDDDEPNELAMLFVTSLGLPMELKVILLLTIYTPHST